MNMTRHSKEQIADWVKDNLFGDKALRDALNVPLTPTQEAIAKIAVEIILKWESR